MGPDVEDVMDFPNLDGAASAVERRVGHGDTELLNWVIGYSPRIMKTASGEWVWVEWRQYGETRRTCPYAHGRAALGEALEMSLLTPNVEANRTVAVWRHLG